MRHATGNLTIRVVLWLLGLAAVGAAVLSADRVLRTHPTSETAGPVILPPPSGDATRRAINDAANTVAALTGGTGDNKRDSALRDDAGRNDGSPSFDIARVEPSGDIVIAGRAAPGATVELLRNGQVHDRGVADAAGQFAMVPSRLPIGDSELSLRATLPDKAPVISKQTVVVSVPENLKDQPVVALMAPDQASRVLSRPATPDAASSALAVVTVEVASGKLFVSGHAPPGAMIRLYLNDDYQATATADGSGHVAFTTAGDDAIRDYRVRLDEVDRLSGAIRSRAEVPFTTPPQTVATRTANARADANAPAANNDGVSGPQRGPKTGQSVTVSRGDSLWRISRLAYGDGTRYTVIYDANHRQIRNPDRIYPGQVFIIPDKPH